MTRSLKTIRSRMRSVMNTQKVTHALEMISGAKLHRTDFLLFALRPYFFELESLLNNFVNANPKALTSPFLAEKASKQNLILCLVTSDSGLCGMYNNNIIGLAEEFIGLWGQEKIKLVAVGRKGLNYFRKRGLRIAGDFSDLHGRYNEKTADGICSKLVDLFITGGADEIYIAYTFYKNALIHRPKIDKFLNLTVPQGKTTEYILEPGKERIAQELIPRFLRAKLRLLLLEAFTSEHAARLMAMRTATDNAEELMEALTLLRNKMRQANITQEIMEIVGSTEALKG